MQAERHLSRPGRLGPGAPECHRRRHRRGRCRASPPGEPAHRPTRPTGRRRRPGRDPGGWPTLMRQVPDHPCPLPGSRPQPSLLAQTLGRTSSRRSPAGPLRPTDTSDQDIRLLHQGRGASPTAAARGSSAPCSPTILASLRSGPVCRAHHQREQDQDKAPLARPSSPWPTAN